MSSTSYGLIPYFTSGAVHLSAVGLAWVGFGYGVTPPSFEMKWGDMGASVSSAGATGSRGPLDEGLLVSVLGDEQAPLDADSSLLSKVAVDVIHQSPPTIEIQIPVAQAVPTQTADPHNIDRQIASLSNPVRLNEPAFEPPRPSPAVASKSIDAQHVERVEPPPQPEPLDRPEVQTPPPMIVEKALPPQPRQVVVASPEEPPLPDIVANRPHPTPVPQATNETKSVPVLNELGTSLTASAQPTAQREPQSGIAVATPRPGQSDAAAERGQNSRASAESVASELPPGAVADRRPSLMATNLPPKYPAEAYQQGQQGLVVLLVKVGADGRVSQAKVDQSSGFTLLDDAALATIKTWRFEPAMFQGRPVASPARVPIRFRLADGE